MLADLARQLRLGDFDAGLKPPALAPLVWFVLG